MLVAEQAIASGLSHTLRQAYGRRLAEESAILRRETPKVGGTGSQRDSFDGATTSFGIEQF